MAQVEIPTRFESMTAGETTLTIAASSVRQLLRELEARFPGIVDQLRSTTTLAIDGEVIGDSVDDASLERLQPDSEVFFVPAIAGGCAAL
jgi:molybdopterin converting factor small subunit